LEGEKPKTERYGDWPERLARCIAAARTRRFAWGEHDCALFAADCVQAMTGRDPAGAYRGRYRTALGVARLLRQRNSDLAGAWTAALGAPLANPAYAQRGDVVVFAIAAFAPPIEANGGATGQVLASIGGAKQAASSGGAGKKPLAAPGGGQINAAATGICLGSRCAAAGPGGLSFVPLAAARLAWRV
jgi:hypothetical protein